MAFSLKDFDFGTPTYSHHIKHPKVSLDDHLRSKGIENGQIVADRKSIYLDTRFWILLRDAHLGRATNPLATTLLKALRHVVSEKKAICPFAANIFVEVLKQNDDVTRLATATVIDELSECIALQPEEDRIATEIIHFIEYMRKDPNAVFPLNHLVWTSPSNVLGFSSLEHEAWSPHQMLAIQKAFTDATWKLGFVQIANESGPIPNHLTSQWEKNATTLNEMNRAHANTMRSFEQVYLDEFIGALELYKPTLSDILLYLFMNETGERPNTDDKETLKLAEGKLASLIQQAFQNNDLGPHLPTLHIRAALSASIRWNQGRKLTGNDLHDFGHAAAALPYHNIFATENSLCHLLTNELDLAERYNTKVVSTLSGLISTIEEI